MEFSLEKMGKRIASDVPGLLSFLGGICSGGKLGDGEMDDKTGEGGIGVSGRGRLGVGAETRRKVSLAKLLEIVSLLARCFRSSPQTEEDHRREYVSS